MIGLFNKDIELEENYNLKVNNETWDFYIQNNSLTVEFSQLVENYLQDLITLIEEKTFIVSEV